MRQDVVSSSSRNVKKIIYFEKKTVLFHLNFNPWIQISHKNITLEIGMSKS